MENFSYTSSLLVLSAISIAGLVNIVKLTTTPNTQTLAPEKVSTLPTREKTITTPVTVNQASLVKEAIPLTSTQPTIQYIEVIDSCGPQFEGDCVHARSGPGTEYALQGQLRAGMVLRVATTTTDEGGRTWYKIKFESFLVHPERVVGDWYVAGDYVRPFMSEGNVDLTKESATTTKRIVIDRSEQKLYAYDGEELFMEQTVSTGLNSTPTPRGTFTIYKKMPSRYMQGPLPGLTSQYYDLPGVPWVLYFTSEGAAIHGTYWHDKFGQRWSHGCVNLPYAEAQKLYAWANVGTPVTVQE
jgi:lipoprotein-anchoring transpeptidase ErfK/SrfK